MKKTVKVYHQMAVAKHTQHKTFLNWLKKKKPKDLDQTAQQMHDEVFEEINCAMCQLLQNHRPFIYRKRYRKNLITPQIKAW